MPEKEKTAKRRPPMRPTAERLFDGKPLRRARFESARYALEAARLIRMMRKEANLDQSELAERLGVSQPRVSQLERGEGVDGPGYVLLRRVAEVCGVVWHDPLTGLAVETQAGRTVATM